MLIGRCTLGKRKVSDKVNFYFKNLKKIKFTESMEEEGNKGESRYQ